MPQLEIDTKAILARNIAARLVHDFGAGHAKAMVFAAELSEILDRKPQDAFGVTFEQLCDAVIWWKLTHPEPLVVRQTP